MPGYSYGGKLTKAAQWMNHRTDQRKDGPKPHYIRHCACESTNGYSFWDEAQPFSFIRVAFDSNNIPDQRRTELCFCVITKLHVFHKGVGFLGVTDQLQRLATPTSGYDSVLSCRSLSDPPAVSGGNPPTLTLFPPRFVCSPDIGTCRSTRPSYTSRNPRKARTDCAPVLPQ